MWRKLALAALALLLAVPAVAASQQDDTQKKLDAVRRHIAELSAGQEQATAQRDRLGKALATQARALDKAAAELRQSEEQLAALESRLAELDAEQRTVQASLDQQHEALAELLRATYKLGHGSDLRMLLGHVGRCPPTADGGASGDDCAPGDEALAQVQRALVYSRYFQADRAQRIRGLLEDLAARDRLAEQVSAQKLDIEAQRDQRRQQREALALERRQQEKLLAEVEADMAARGARIQRLEQDRQSLQKLLDNLRDVFADIPSELTEDKPFSQRRGQLSPPLAGTRSTQKDGLLITARTGSKVRAVAHGRVAYADWLRGYGMLLIIDHGEGWMSLYGGNESLLRGVGDWVNGGDVVAVSGRGEGSQPGLYFGLRHKGQSVNPAPWLKKP